MHSVFTVNLLGPAVCYLCLEESDGENLCYLPKASYRGIGSGREIGTQINQLAVYLVPP